MANIRNQAGKCETIVSVKKDVKDLHVNLSKFTKGKENLDLILIYQTPSLNKTELGFEYSIRHSKGFNSKKLNHSIYKCTFL